MRLEEWEEAPPKHQAGEKGDGGESTSTASMATAVVPPGVTLCKTLGVIASGGRGASRGGSGGGGGGGDGDVTLVVCMLEVRDRLRLDMDALAGLLRGGDEEDEEEDGGFPMKCRLVRVVRSHFIPN